MVNVGRFVVEDDVEYDGYLVGFDVGFLVGCVDWKLEGAAAGTSVGNCDPCC